MLAGFLVEGDKSRRRKLNYRLNLVSTPQKRKYLQLALKAEILFWSFLFGDFSAKGFG